MVKKHGPERVWDLMMEYNNQKKLWKPRKLTLIENTMEELILTGVLYMNIVLGVDEVDALNML